ncbi:MAG TPA: hypothetical protein VKO61_00615 [Candidatus Paceibacterota bacterium]|nr:hypothetical protein [Candidatus Paceibacterota bacterium]
MNHLEHSQKVKSDAEVLLDEADIIDVYSEFGRVYVIGSFAADLMWDPDIDLVVITKNLEESSKKALEKIVINCYAEFYGWINSLLKF